VLDCTVIYILLIIEHITDVSPENSFFTSQGEQIFKCITTV